MFDGDSAASFFRKYINILLNVLLGLVCKSDLEQYARFDVTVALANETSVALGRRLSWCRGLWRREKQVAKVEPVTRPSLDQQFGVVVLARLVQRLEDNLLHGVQHRLQCVLGLFERFRELLHQNHVVSRQHARNWLVCCCCQRRVAHFALVATHRPVVHIVQVHCRRAEEVAEFEDVSRRRRALFFQLTVGTVFIAKSWRQMSDGVHAVVCSRHLMSYFQYMKRMWKGELVPAGGSQNARVRIALREALEAPMTDKRRGELAVESGFDNGHFYGRIETQRLLSGEQELTLERILVLLRPNVGAFVANAVQVG